MNQEQEYLPAERREVIYAHPVQYSPPPAYPPHNNVQHVHVHHHGGALSGLFNLIIVALFLVAAYAGYQLYQLPDVDSRWEQVEEWKTNIGEILNEGMGKAKGAWERESSDWNASENNPQQSEIKSSSRSNVRFYKASYNNHRKTNNRKKYLIQYVNAVGTSYGLPHGYLPTVMQIESNLNPHAKRPTFFKNWKVAAGGFQFIGSTGISYGLVKFVNGKRIDNRFDLHKSAHAAAKYSASNMKHLERKLNVRINDENQFLLYMAYNMGLCGYKSILRVSNNKSLLACGNGKKMSLSTLYRNVYYNTTGKYKLTVKRNGVYSEKLGRYTGRLNKKSAKAYIDYMSKHYFPKGQRKVNKIMGGEWL